MKIYYRISDKSYEKSKLIGATKEVCLMNFCRVFKNYIFNDSPMIKIIADNCSRETTKMLKNSGLPLMMTNAGNAGSLKVALKLAMDDPDDELVYFVEDDYLHLDTSPNLLHEGIKRSDYVTLYDHPDKYTRFYDGGEYSKVIRTTSSHWRYTISTCMTFGVKVKTLKDDIEIWHEFTDGDHPHDHLIFKKLCEEKRRRLAVCIPGAACHTDLSFSAAANQLLIDPWAIDMMINQRNQEIEDNIKDEDFKNMKECLLLGKTGMEKLIALDALYKEISIDNNK